MASTELLALLSAHVYGDASAPALPPGVQQLPVSPEISKSWADSGFSGAVYHVQETNEVVVAFRGTEVGDPGDLRSDRQIVTGFMPSQYSDAYNFFDWARRLYGFGGAPLVLTGHSLGGSLVQLVKIKLNAEGVTGVSAETFGAPGVASLRDLPGSPIGVDGLVNHITPGDPAGSVGRHVGTVDIVPHLPGVLTPYDCSLAFGPVCFRFFFNEHSILNYLQLFTKAAGIAVYSPLVLDLDGDGVETTPAAGPTYFDHGADGFAERTGWAGADDALLVRDRDGDGRITSGRELFGTGTLLAGGALAADGFQALAELDANHDGRVDAADPAWAELRVWQDADGDGVSREAELGGLDPAGIAGLDTTHATSTVVDASGNAHREQGRFRWADGREGALTDVWFAVNPTETLPADLVPVPPVVAALADLPGHGRVHDLHQVMASDASGHLRDLVERFTAEPDGGTRLALAEQILLAWTGAEGVSPTGRGPHVDGRQLAAMERLYGRDYVGADGTADPNRGAGPVLQQAYASLLESIHAQLMVQTHARDLFALVTYRPDAAPGAALADLGGVEAELRARLLADPIAGRDDLAGFARSIRALGVEAETGFWDFRERLAAGDETLRWVMDAAGRAPVEGTAAPDALTGSSGADALRGGDGNDVLGGGSGRDTLHGEAGADELYGDGEDDLLVGGPGDDRLYGGADGDRLEGGAGTDMLSGEAGGDALVGGAGNDQLWGGDADDVLDGGSGDDTLDGGFGNDTYLLRRAMGRDVVNDRDWQFPDTDRVLVDADLVPADVQIRRGGDDLVLSIRGTADEMRLAAWFLEGYGSAFEVQRVEFLADGSVQDVDAIRALLLQGTAGADWIVGYSSADAIAGLGGDDTLAGAGGDDRLDGGAGADALRGDAGNDALAGGDGADVLSGGTGDDVLDGGPGDDWMDGGYGNDTYRFGPGGGRDTLDDTDWSSPDTDRLVFGADVGPDDVLVGRSGDDLVLRLADTADQVTARYWFMYGAGQYHELTRVELADGTAWDVPVLDQLARAVTGTAGPDTLTGTAGGDVLRGLAGADVLSGAAGNDRLDGGGGADTLAGGAGDDTYVVDGPGDLVVEAAGEGVDTVESVVDFTLPAEVERLVLGGAAVRGTGNGLANVLAGNGAANALDGGAGADDMTGSAGDDVYTVDQAGDRVTERAGEGHDTVRAGVTFALPAEVEDLVLTGSAAVNGTGNALANRLTGNGAANVLDGGAAADWLAGGGGNDTYTVDDPGDVVVEASGAGTDTVRSSVTFALPANVEKLTLLGSAPIGGSGNALANTLTGNAGANVLAGGAGNDTYVIQNPDDVVVERAGEGTDTVQSSVSYVLPAQVEHLTLTGSASVAATGNDLANTLTGNGAANVIDGGAGNDTLKGGKGGDTYLFARGGGQDTIVESDATAGVTDTARLGGGLAPLDLVLSQRANDLLVSVQGGTDSVAVKDWFLGPAYRVEALEAGGQRLLSSQVAQLIQDMAQWSAGSGLTWAQGAAEEPAEVQAVLATHWQPA